MRDTVTIHRTFALSAVLFCAVAFTPSPASAVLANCDDIRGEIGGDWDAVRDALIVALGGTSGDATANNNTDLNGGLPLPQWVVVVDRDGKVCAVFFSGADRQSQWPASRVISMQKANTANSLSLDGLALSTANLWASNQPGGSLYGLQFSNPVNPEEAYEGDANQYGNGTNDPAVGERIGGINVFGGGLGLYNSSVIGGIGTSGNTSCADHIITWKVRDILDLDNVPAGVSPTGDDNIIFDLLQPDDESAPAVVSEGGFGHPECGFGETDIAEALPETNPVDD